MAAIVGIISRLGFRIEVRHRNQTNKSKLGVSINWTGLLDWTTGLDYWTGLLDSKVFGYGT